MIKLIEKRIKDMKKAASEKTGTEKGMINYSIYTLEKLLKDYSTEAKTYVSMTAWLKNDTYDDNVRITVNVNDIDIVDRENNHFFEPMDNFFALTDIEFEDIYEG